MSSKTREQARKLVEKILCQDNLGANQILKKLILQAEQEREAQADAQANPNEGGDELTDDTGTDTGGGDNTEATDDGTGDDGTGDEGIGDDGTGDEGIGDEGGDEFDDEQTVSDDQVEQTVDDQIQINCQINASILEDLLNRIAELKTAFQNMGLDKHQRQYFEIKVPIQYYSEKLQKLQNKTNPGIDQEQVKNQLDDISTSLDELESKINGGETAEDEQVKSPDELNAEEGISEPTEEGQQGQEETEKPEPQEEF